jgi:6-phosphogluconolactonase (cycloisomerase 2 family)
VLITSTRGRIPRDFCLSAQSDCILVANQDSDSLWVARVDKETGFADETSVMLRALDASPCALAL